MSSIEKKVDALTRFLLCEDTEEREKLRAEIKKLCSLPKPAANPEAIIRSIFLEIGVPDHLKGYEPTIRAILMIIEDHKYLDSVTYRLYPEVAKEFNNTKGGIERSIRLCVEHAWQRGNLEALTRYFGYTTSPERGKPTNSEFLGRIANVVKQRLHYDV